MNLHNKKYITISVDDGFPSDQRAAELLDRYGLKGTFYIPARNPERELLSTEGIRSIASQFEVGAHTFNHRPLTGLPFKTVEKEVQEGKTWLEDVTGTPVRSFCYPRGKFNSDVLRAVKNAGFSGARTCLFNVNNTPKSPYLWGVSTHAYSHSPHIQIRHALLEKNFLGLWNYLNIFRLEKDWANHFRTAVKHVDKCGGIAHLYLHSWEMEEQREWKKLEYLLQFISKNGNLTPITNGDLFAQWK